MKQFLFDRRMVSSPTSAATLMFVCAIAIAAAFGLGGFGPSHANADGRSPGAWTVDAATGNVEMQLGAGASWVSLRSGAAVPGPATIRTGSDGSATLIRDVDRIVLSASTEVQLPGAGDGDAATRIVQPEGEALFEVGPRPGWSFSVDTPYLAVVVKGTKFGVGVSGDGTSVSVSEGRVQVGRAGGRSVDVSAGETARTGATAGSDISVTRSSDGSAAAPEAAASPQGATTGGAPDSPGRSGSSGNGASGSGNGNSGDSGNGNNGDNGSGNNGNRGNGDNGNGNNGNNGNGNNGNGND